MIAKGRLPKSENLKVVVLGGDGSTYDMALSSTSGAISRQLDFYYFCYDNEAYGNTGVQLSPATPYGARTTTSPCAASAHASRTSSSSRLRIAAIAPTPSGTADCMNGVDYYEFEWTQTPLNPASWAAMQIGRAHV